MNFNIASIGDLKVPNKLGIQPCFVPSFLYETFLHSLACLEHIKLSCRTPFTKICLFRGGFSTGILISHNGFTLSASYESLYQSTCVIHVNQIEFTYLHVKYYSKQKNNQNNVSLPDVFLDQKAFETWISKFLVSQTMLPFYQSLCLTRIMYTHICGKSSLLPNDQSGSARIKTISLVRKNSSFHLYTLFEKSNFCPEIQF